MEGYTAEKDSVILRYSMNAEGTIWCRAYTEEERPYATVEGVYKSVRGLPVTAHVSSSYYTFCVAENLRQVAMNNTLQSTELHVVTLVGRRAAAR